MADVITTLIDLGTPINVTVEANGAEWIAEENRRDNEAQRVQAETVRTENENIRKQAENQRIQNENLRKRTVETIEREYAPRLNAVESGSPKGVFGSLALLQTDTNANTTEGKKYTYITTDNGNWNYWDSTTSTWKAGGLYQSVKGEAYNININDADNNFEANNVEDALKEVAIKNQASNALVGKATGELLSIYTAPAKARKLDILGNTIATPTDPTKPISPDNPAILESVGEGNLFDGLLESGGYFNGVKGSATSYIRSVNKFHIQPNTAYTVSNNKGNTNGNIIWFDKGGNFISNSSDLVNQISPRNAYQCAINIFATNINIADYTWCQLNYGSTPQPYVPYGSFKVHVCGKNLLPNNATTQTINGVTFTVNPDKSITANGTATSNISLSIVYSMNYSQNAGNYILSGCPSNGSETTFLLRTGGLNVPNVYDLGNGASYTLKTKSNIGVALDIKSGYTCNNLVFKPMIRLTSDTDNTYSPYIGQEYTVPLKDTQGNFIPFRGLETAQDRIFKDIDGLWKKKANTKEYTLLASDVTRMYTGFANRDMVYLKLSTLIGMSDYGITDNIATKLLTQISTPRNNISLDGADVYWKHGISDTEWYITMPKNKYATLVEVQTALAGTKIIYPLATPTTITLHADAQTVLNQIEKLKDGQTVIYGTDKVSPSFDVEYVEDANKVIGNLKDEITKLKLALINLGGNV